VIQKYLESTKGKQLKPLLKSLSEMILPLSRCLHGNYIIQYILENGPLDEKNTILTSIRDNFVELSLDKFASNVMERAIIKSNSNYRKELLKILSLPHKEK